MTWTVGVKVVQVISSVSTRQRIGLQARLGQAAGMLARRWLSSPCHPAAQNEQWCAAAKSVVTCDCNGTSDSTLVPLNDGQGSPGRPHLHGLFLEFRSVILSFRHFPLSPFREDLIDPPVRELGGTSTVHLAVAGGVHIGRADGLRRGALRLQERVGYPVAESQQAGSGQCYRQGAAPPDGVG